MSKLHNPYGDGLASKRIVEFIKKKASKKKIICALKLYWVAYGISSVKKPNIYETSPKKLNMII